MLASSRRRLLLLLFALIVALSCYSYYRNSDIPYRSWLADLSIRHDVQRANRTLGFGAIVAVSRDRSPRRRDLLQAANVTDVDIVIPQQREYIELDIEKFRNGQEDFHRGSLLAWLGHLNALQWFLESGLETALFLEDDVDWDIRLRCVQIPLAASVARALFASRPLQTPGLPITRRSRHYWGNPGAWDLLYLGHCGDYFHSVPTDERPLRSLKDEPHITYRDPTLPPPAHLHPFTQELLDDLGVPDHARVLHRSKFPLCSFGYAVTRKTAKRLVHDLAAPRLRANGPRAFDVALLHACNRPHTDTSEGPMHREDVIPPRSTTLPARDTKSHRQEIPSPGLRCYTLNPELFHHKPGLSQIATINTNLDDTAPSSRPQNGGNIGIPPVDLAGQQLVKERNETVNIDCGFWSGHFAFREEDGERLEWLRKEVGLKGRCLKGGRGG